MREVNNNTVNSANLNFQSVQPTKPEATSLAETENITDLANVPADVIGRSQVTKPAIEEDVEFFVKNPEKVENANKLFDYLVDEQHMNYEDAAKIVKCATDEFSH